MLLNVGEVTGGQSCPGPEAGIALAVGNADAWGGSKETTLRDGHRDGEGKVLSLRVL